MVSLRLAVSALIWMSLLTSGIQAQQQPPDGWVTVNVRYGYFSETRPMLAACARGWFDLAHEPTRTYYKVGCYPQSSGNFVSSRLDNLELDIAHIGSTPWAQGTLGCVRLWFYLYYHDAEGRMRRLTALLTWKIRHSHLVRVLFPFFLEHKSRCEGSGCSANLYKPLHGRVARYLCPSQ